MIKKLKNIIFGAIPITLIVFCHGLVIPAFADPMITSITPNTIAQGQTVNAVVSGSNLDENVAAIGIIGGGITAVVLNADPGGNSLTIQLQAASDASPGNRDFFVGTLDNKRATYPIQVTLGDEPTVAIIYPSSATPGETKFIQIAGQGLTNISSVRSANEFDLTINSFRYYPHGTILDLSVSVDPNAAVPATHEIFIETGAGQQARTYFNVVSSNLARFNTDESYSDPFSPGIYEVSRNPVNDNQIILKGSMFSPETHNNIVTILETIDGTVTSRQVNVNYANDNELIIELPTDINSDHIGIAVSNEGKSSNIKSIELTALNDNSNTNFPETIQPQPNNQESPDNTSITVTNNTENDLLAHNETEPTPIVHDIEPIDNINDIDTLQPLTQVLFTDNKANLIDEKINEAALKDINDPAKLISDIETNKKVQEQSELVELALDEAKKAKDKEMQETLKKAETLKSKVDELEQLLDKEKKKHNPDRRKLAKYEKLLLSANAESRSQTFALLNDLLKYKPQLKDLLVQKPFDLAAVQPNIPPDSAIIQYVPTEEGLIIFVVDKDNLKTRVNKNISKEILNLEVKAFRQLFESEIEKIKQTGRVTPITTWKRTKSESYTKDILPIKERSIFLYKALIEPIEKDIADKQVIAIIANGWLRYLPFQSLGKLTKDGDVNFLAANKSVVYLDSVLALSKNKPNAISTMASIAVIANPDGSLNGANQEAEVISNLFGMSTVSIINKSFDKELINNFAKKTDILHLATHGHFDGSDISSSYLLAGRVTTKKETKISKLHLSDIYDLNLQNSRLVVLSGCDTGKIGNLENEPDDIVGSLATAFRVAGANTILASLWKAHDDATKILMQDFYTNIKQGLSKAEALRRASLKVKENPKYGHPLFWSLFSLIGDWR